MDASSLPTAPSLPRNSRSTRASSGAAPAAAMAASARRSSSPRSALTLLARRRGRGTGRARELDQLVERGRVLHGELGELFPVQLDPALLQAVDEGRVGEPARARGRVDARDPQRAVLALLAVTVARAVGQRAHDRLVDRAPQARAAAPETLGAPEVAGLLVPAGCPVGCAYHGLGPHHLAEEPRPHAGDHERLAQGAPLLPGVRRVHVAARVLGAQHLAALADAEAL